MVSLIQKFRHRDEICSFAHLIHDSIKIPFKFIDALFIFISCELKINISMLKHNIVNEDTMQNLRCCVKSRLSCISAIRGDKFRGGGATASNFGMFDFFTFLTCCSASFIFYDWNLKHIFYCLRKAKLW